MVKAGKIVASSKAELKRKEKQQKKLKSGGFESLKLSSNVYNAIKKKGYRVPTPIQRKTMPLILAGHDVVAMARTGSGKTAAFLVPMLEKLQQHVPQAGVRALIISPTRDLALQTLKFTKELGKFTDLRVSLLVGGDSMESQFEELAQNPDIIIATPGRLMHHLNEVEDMSLRTVEYVVFDEADRLFERGDYAQQLPKIFSQLNENRQTLLFSATLPSNLADFAKAGLRDPQLVRLDLDTKISPDLTLTFFTLSREEKYAAILYLLREHISSDQQTLIFVSTKYHVEFLNLLCKEEGIEPSICYGDMDQDARKIHISRFRNRKTMLLIVTDVAARGIDIPLLDNVINFDFPAKPKLFVHRVGRAARAGRTGTAFSFVTSEDMPYVLDLHLFLSKPIRAAPVQKEEEDMSNVRMEIDQAVANGETVYGRLPQPIIDLMSDRVREIIESSTELSALVRPCAKAFRLYSTTKPKPSRESVKRAKALPREGLHPVFGSAIGDAELSALAFSERLKSFRPKQTILEAEGEAAKSKRKGPTSQWVDVMKKKRAIHEEVINKVHQQRSNNRLTEEAVTLQNPSTSKEKQVSGLKRKAKSFKDEEYFISSVPMNQHFESGLSVRNNQGFESNRLEGAVLDLVADDKQGLHKQKTSYHWDRRSKKYVKLNNGERVTASGKVKTEGGAKVQGKKTGMYKKWTEQTHKRISLAGSRNSGGTAEASTSLAGGAGNMDTGRFRGGRKRHIANAHVRSEIKDVEQVRKERQSKANRMAHMNKGKSKKGKKFNKNGKRGKKK